MTNYADIHRHIDRAASGDDASGEAIRRWVLDVLAGIADSRRRLDAVRHPLGFVCLPVERSGDDGICVHLWSPDVATAEPTTSTVHSHSWDLLSYVLFGQVSNEIVKVADDASDPAYRVYEVVSHGEVDEIRSTPRLVRRSDGDVRVAGAGEAYTLPAGHFHETVTPPGQQAATVALGRVRRGLRDLSLGAVDGHTHRVRRQRCDPGTTVRTARTIADRVAAAAYSR